MTRTTPNLTQKLDAALLALLDARGTPIPREEAKELEDGKVAALFELDHWPIAVALGGVNHASNLEWRLKAEHREKTAKRDIPAIAKVKRLTKKHEEHRAKLLAVDAEAAEVVNRLSKATIASRGFDKSKTRTFKGTVVDRKTRGTG